MAMCKDVWFMDSGINVVGKVERKGVPKLVDTKYGASKKVCGAFLKDETGEVRLTLWDSDVERIENGYTIKIRNGYTTRFRGEKYLSSGFYGSIDIISTDPDYDSGNCTAPPPETHSKTSTKNYNPSSSEDTPFSIISEKDQDIPHPDLGEIAKIERQYWRESLA